MERMHGWVKRTAHLLDKLTCTEEFSQTDTQLHTVSGSLPSHYVLPGLKFTHTGPDFFE